MQFLAKILLNGFHIEIIILECLNFLPQNREQVHFNAIIYHKYDNQTMETLSPREGNTCNFKVKGGNHMKFVENQDSITTNYTFQDHPIYFRPNGVVMLFYRGILYPDIIEMNVSLTIDPEEIRPVGFGLEKHNLV